VTAIVVIKILLVGALLGGFIMFSIFRRKQFGADGKPIGMFATLINFIARVVLIGVVAFASFWFITKFLG
jgi:hypothetical protein